jgi:hypothetical protein
MSSILPRLTELYPLQAQIIEHPARFKVVVLGRRSGKTEIAKTALDQNSRLDPRPYAYFTPTYKMLREVWEGMKTRLHGIIQSSNEAEKRLILETGATIDFWSLTNPDGPRGRAYRGVILDEAASIPNLEYAWNEVIMPTLADYQGWAYFLSTPRGRNFFWQLYQRGLDPLQTDWMSWQHPTSVNPHIQPSEIELARRNLPERSFKQEYLAEFVEDSGAVFRNIRPCIKPPANAPGPFVFGVDWGRHNDYTAIAVFCKSTFRLVHLDRFNQIGWSFQRGRLRLLAEKWHPDIILAETNSIGEPNIEALQREGLPVQGFTTTSASKGALIEELALDFEQEAIGILDDPVLLNELEAYELERLSSGQFRYSAPPGGHDDCVIALALARRAAHLSAARVIHRRTI